MENSPEKNFKYIFKVVLCTLKLIQLCKEYILNN